MRWPELRKLNKLSPVGNRPPAEGHGTVSVADWARKRLGIQPDATQCQVLNSQTKRGILNCTRQWGKSTISAAKAVHQAVTVPGSLVLVVSPSTRQSAEFVRKAESFLICLGIRPKGDGDNPISVALPNGSRIVGLPGKEATVRGFSAVSMVFIDEASRVPDELYLALRPMLAVSGGSLWMMSTPFAKRGFFFETWRKGGEEWEKISVKAEDCARIPASFLAEEKRSMPQRNYEQEYCCVFHDVVGAVFPLELLEAAITDKVKPLKLGEWETYDEEK